MLRQNTAISLREKCPYSEFFWSAFSRIQSKCGKIRPEKLRIRTLHAVSTNKSCHKPEKITRKWISFIYLFISIILFVFLYSVQLYYLYFVQIFFIFTEVYVFFFFFFFFNFELFVTSYSNEQHVIWRIFYILLEPNILPPHCFHKISPSNSISVICGLA